MSQIMLLAVLYRAGLDSFQGHNAGHCGSQMHMCLGGWVERRLPRREMGDEKWSEVLRSDFRHRDDVIAPNNLLADVTGSITGVVHDPSQAVVKGAHVTVTNTQTNLSQHTVSADDGSYRFLALPVGIYR